MASPGVTMPTPDESEEAELNPLDETCPGANQCWGATKQCWTDLGLAVRTFQLLNLTSLVEAADLTVLPAVFHELSEEFGVTPSQLGTLTLMRGLLQALVSPTSGILAGKYDRVKLIAYGCFFWAAATAGIGMATNFNTVIALRTINGVGLGFVLPLIQSLNSDLHPQKRLGKTFGMLRVTGAVGSTFGAYLGTVMAATTVAGLAGWRAAFFLLAVMSVVCCSWRAARRAVGAGHWIHDALLR